MIAADPDLWPSWLLRAWAAPGFEFDKDHLREFARCFAKPDVIRGTCEDYRAGATIDAELDAADRQAGRKIQCPVMCLWGGISGFGGSAGKSPLDIWRQWSDGPVSGAPLQTGHFLPEEAPAQVLEHLSAFLNAD